MRTEGGHWAASHAYCILLRLENREHLIMAQVTENEGPILALPGVPKQSPIALDLPPIFDK